MSKNLEDLLYRGDSLEKMSTMSSDLRDASKKYRRAAVRINWQLLLQQVCIRSRTSKMSTNVSTVRSVCCAGIHNTVLHRLALLVDTIARQSRH